MILLIDNYDSFVHNLARYFEELGQRTRVVRNDALSVDEVRDLAPESIVLSPGPCDPSKAGICLEVVRRLGARIPILGVCLGHQAIAQAYGGRIVRDTPRHGRTSEVLHDEAGIFEGVPSPFPAARYHSLHVSRDGLPAELEVTAQTRDGKIMGLRHRSLPVIGVQFHPESELTEHGHRLLANFLRSTGATVPVSLSESA
jgi:anthranilate synthase/aminodeoxychorismate synthase-like glutamine amidotransferase